MAVANRHAVSPTGKMKYVNAPVRSVTTPTKSTMFECAERKSNTFKKNGSKNETDFIISLSRARSTFRSDMIEYIILLTILYLYTVFFILESQTSADVNSRKTQKAFSRQKLIMFIISQNSTNSSVTMNQSITPPHQPSPTVT